MFKKLSLKEQAKVLEAMGILEEKYNPDHVQMALEVMSGKLDELADIEKIAERDSKPLTKKEIENMHMESKGKKVDAGLGFDPRRDMEVIEGPKNTKKDPEPIKPIDDNDEIGGNRAKYKQEKLFEDKEIKRDRRPPITKKMADMKAREHYGVPLNDALVIQYYKERKTQKQIGEFYGCGQRAISSWIREIPQVTTRRVLASEEEKEG